jgi:hypothetical protein
LARQLVIGKRKSSIDSGLQALGGMLFGGCIVLSFCVYSIIFCASPITGKDLSIPYWRWAIRSAAVY